MMVPLIGKAIGRELISVHQYFPYYHCEGVQLGLQPNRQGTPSKPLSWIDGTNTYPTDLKGLVGGTNT